MKVALIDIDKLKPYGNNPRDNKPAIQAVKKSLEQYGFRQPIVADKHYVIVVGHTRYLAALELGLKRVPVHIADMTAKQAKAYRIADNKTNEYALWIDERLQQELKGLDDWYTGFDLQPETPPVGDEQLIPEPPRHVISKLGDVWTLGDHKVYCGDSTQITLDQQVDMIWTDPPYNVAYKGTANTSKIANDDLPDDKFVQLLTDVFTNITNKLKPGGAAYVAFSGRTRAAFTQAVNQSGLVIKQDLIWLKNHFVLGWSDYQPIYEPILYCIKPGAPRYFTLDRTLKTLLKDYRDLNSLSKKQLIDIINTLPADVIECPKPTISAEHPTMKPVDLIKVMIDNSSQPGETIVDPFGGSGSTLIAAHALNRKAILIELEPKYVDVIIRRWQQYTGLQAVNQDGETYQQLGGEYE